MKNLILSALVLFTSMSYATPGDVGCTGLSNGKKVDVLLGFDHHGQTTPSVVWISINGERLFDAQQIERRGSSRKMIVVASDETSAARIVIKKDSQALLTVKSDSEELRFNKLKLSCE